MIFFPKFNHYSTFIFEEIIILHLSLQLECELVEHGKGCKQLLR